MSSTTRRGTQRSLQNLLLKRFAMAFASYAMMALVCWFAVFNGLFLGSVSTAAWLTLGVFGSQLVFLWLFLSGRNLRFDDPSLTEAQVLVALAWQPPVLAFFDSARGSMLVFYILILLFGVFQLPPRVFVRCAAFAFFGFTAMVLIEAYRMQLVDPSMAWLQVWVLFIMLVWLCLFSSYVQAMRKRMRQRRFALQAHQDTLRGMMRQLEDLVATDELTGLFNRRHFLRLASRELQHMGNGRQHGLALIDLDHFKRINDAHGHAAGDRVLQTFAAVARACLRDGDIIARYGGEEFVLLLPNTDADQFTACCERLREAFATAEPVGVNVENLSLSAGMTLLCADDDLDEALQRADQALYQAKRGGRNRCDASWEGAGA
ncbi:GGDEF domain-containing protein [Pseudomonas berkeleyensis]|uniref:diguanylate cyclase n=1 Tax=Pseudomonas berkeleyensis TaxID=2726956 RepID=A0A7G5DTE3_9PSED|nr:GGDEF domain-containing protein [Pseudomonas berkeleyensis]QMV65018.1 GGDEF domain-containing protein [Pseudomonas berkeleyensis]WSO40487.1 GGDEF domain-containing protein [Pseudomonas berkeleyensis]